MRKLLFMAMILLGGALFSKAYADEPINVPLNFVNEKGISQGNTKSSMPPLIVTQDGNLLTLPAQGNDHMLVLRDDTGTVVYTTFVPAGTTQIVLPSTLSGDFEIRLVADAYYYIGFIVL